MQEQAMPESPAVDKQIRKYPLPPDLPATIDDWKRYMKTHRTVNDEVESIHLQLLADDEKGERYGQLLWAVRDEQAQEGSLSCDNCLVAMMIRDTARDLNESHPLTREKLATISYALGVVLRRYHQDRKFRRDAVAGKTVAPNDGHQQDAE
jgi:hypothetical protein